MKINKKIIFPVSAVLVIIAGIVLIAMIVNRPKPDQTMNGTLISVTIPGKYSLPDTSASYSKASSPKDNLTVSIESCQPGVLVFSTPMNWAKFYEAEMLDKSADSDSSVSILSCQSIDLPDFESAALLTWTEEMNDRLYYHEKIFFDLDDSAVSFCSDVELSGPEEKREMIHSELLSIVNSAVLSSPPIYDTEASVSVQNLTFDMPDDCIHYSSSDSKERLHLGGNYDVDTSMISELSISCFPLTKASDSSQSFYDSLTDKENIHSSDLTESTLGENFPEIAGEIADIQTYSFRTLYETDSQIEVTYIFFEYNEDCYFINIRNIPNDNEVREKFKDILSTMSPINNP